MKYRAKFKTRNQMGVGLGVYMLSLLKGLILE